MNEEVSDRLERGRLNREFILRSPKCIFCNCENILCLTVDHKVPLSRGGTDDDKNKQVCCFFCNQFKDRYTNKEFRDYMRALNILHKLCVVKPEFPSNIPIKFRQGFYPIDKKKEEGVKE